LTSEAANKDSNLGVSSDEIVDIAALHVENCIKRTEGQLRAKGKAFEVAKTQILREQRHRQSYSRISNAASAANIDS